MFILTSFVLKNLDKDSDTLMQSLSKFGLLEIVSKRFFVKFNITKLKKYLSVVY